MSSREFLDMSEPPAVKEVEAPLPYLAPMNRATRRVVEAIALHFHVEPQRVLEEDRHKTVAIVRQVSMYVLREHQRPRPSFPELGREFNRDHTTVMAAVRRVVRMADVDDYVRGAIEVGREALELAEGDKAAAAMLAKVQQRNELQRRLEQLNAEIDRDLNGIEISKVGAAE